MILANQSGEKTLVLQICQDWMNSLFELAPVVFYGIQQWDHQI